MINLHSTCQAIQTCLTGMHCSMMFHSVMHTVDVIMTVLIRLYRTYKTATKALHTFAIIYILSSVNCQNKLQCYKKKLSSTYSQNKQIPYIQTTIHPNDKDIFQNIQMLALNSHNSCSDVIRVLKCTYSLIATHYFSIHFNS